MTWARPQSGELPRAPMSQVSQRFWDGCRERVLRFQRCANCGQPQDAPARVCRWCLSPDLRWEDSTGVGELYSWTTIWRAQAPVFEVPYVAAIIDLDEGFRILSNLVNVEVETIALPLRVQVLFHPIPGDLTLPYFEPDVTA